MNRSPTQDWKCLDKLVLVVGHAVYVGNDPERDGDWFLQAFQSGEPPHYIEQIRFGVDLATFHLSSLLVFSGGQTRLAAGPRSEAQSYRMVAEHFSWWQKVGVRNRAVIEEFARDSFENLLFGIARFRECTLRYPKSVEVVGWAFKRERFDLHRQTIRWPAGNERYNYHGVNNPDDLSGSLRGEAEVRAAFEQDPFGTESHLRIKRVRRNPFHRQPPYAATCPEIAGLLGHKTADDVVYRGSLPWDHPLP